MSRPKAAQRVAAERVTATLTALLSPARAEASRRNGAKSRGPKTPEGKARAAQNALKHGLRAERFTVVGDEDEDEFDAHEAALLAELAPEGALQTILVERIARAAWRLRRADCIEATLFDRLDERGDLGQALTRDCNGARAFETLLRYRGAAQAELFRTLRTLKALQAEQAQAAQERPIGPESRRIPGNGAPAAALVRVPAPAAESPRADLAPRQPTPRAAAPDAPPIEPEHGRKPEAPPRA